MFKRQKLADCGLSASRQSNAQSGPSASDPVFAVRERLGKSRKPTGGYRGIGTKTRVSANDPIHDKKVKFLPPESGPFLTAVR